MKEPAAIINNDSQVKDTGDISQFSAEKNKWSFEYLQRLNTGPFTTGLWNHFHQWSLLQIPDDQKNILSKEEFDKLGKAFINYPLRIFRIAQDMGFELQGMGEIKKRIHDGCLLIGKGFYKLRGTSEDQLMEEYRKAAKFWLEDSGSKDIDPSAVKELAKQFMDTNYFEAGLKIVINNDPKILREYIIARDIPPFRMPDYPLQFLLFALDYFLNQTAYNDPHMSKYKLLSGFLSEQHIALSMSDETVEDALQRQRKNGHFLEDLQSFYKRCQEAYFLPFVECENLDGFDGFQKTRVLVERPDSIKKELYYLYPEWEEVFKSNTSSKD
jgi:hypothetical protein